MKYVYFEKAGNNKSSCFPVFFQCRQRHYKTNFTIFHNNDYSTFWRIPENFFKQNFKYNPQNHTYDNLNKLTYRDIQQYSTVRKIGLG
jgi:hypothetical protein